MKVLAIEELQLGVAIHRRAKAESLFTKTRNCRQESLSIDELQAGVALLKRRVSLSTDELKRVYLYKNEELDLGESLSIDEVQLGVSLSIYELQRSEKSLYIDEIKLGVFKDF